MLAQWPYLVNFLMYLGVSIPLVLLGILLFLFTTPYREYQLIKEGAETTNPQKTAAAKAAAYDLGGKLLGLTLVLSSAIYHSAGVLDLIIWGVVGAVFQVLIFYLFELLTPFRVRSEIPKGNISVGIFSAFLSLSTGLLLAGLISY
jgi:putative membrane protein